MNCNAPVTRSAELLQHTVARFTAPSVTSIAVLLIALLVACGPPETNEFARRVAATHRDSMGAVPQAVRVVRVQNRRELMENSGAAMSARQPGVFFTINDSGHEALLFALDTTGADRGAWRISGATNGDWEALSFGPCASDSSFTARAARACLYIGDIGDNGGSRSTRAVYRVLEPTAFGHGEIQTLPAERFLFRYADGPHDVEAMYVGPRGAVYFITKRPLADTHATWRRALVFRVAAPEWGNTQPQMAELIDSLPVVPGSAFLRLITDAALSDDARYVAVRTYGQVFVFAADSVSGQVVSTIPPATCDLAPLDERQGEGIEWVAGTSRRLLLTSEGRREPLRLVTCPVPEPLR